MSQRNLDLVMRQERQFVTPSSPKVEPDRLFSIMAYDNPTCTDSLANITLRISADTTRNVQMEANRFMLHQLRAYLHVGPRLQVLVCNMMCCCVRAVQYSVHLRAIHVHSRDMSSLDRLCHRLVLRCCFGLVMFKSQFGASKQHQSTLRKNPSQRVVLVRRISKLVVKSAALLCGEEKRARRLESFQKDNQSVVVRCLYTCKRSYCT